MHRLIILVTGTALMFFEMTNPADAKPKTETAQQKRMTECSAQAAGKKGEERKSFMSSCLKGEDSSGKPKLTAQQEKMKSCNQEAATKHLSGKDRESFMSGCLSTKS